MELKFLKYWSCSFLNNKFHNRSLCFRCFFTSSPTYGKDNPLFRKPIRVITKHKSSTEVEKHKIASSNKQYLSEENVPRSLINPSFLGPPIISYENAKEENDKIIASLSKLKNLSHDANPDKVLLEGVRLINDALLAGFKPEMILFSREDTLSKLRIKVGEKVPVYRLLYKTLQVWSSLKTCPGIMGIFKKPSHEQLDIMSASALPITIICHNIVNCGTLGAIIRSAAAIGCKAVILLKGCTHAWKSDVLRSGCGAHFRIPIIPDVEWIQVSNYIPKDSKFFLINNNNSSNFLSNKRETYIDFTEDWNIPETLSIKSEENEAEGLLNKKCKQRTEEFSSDEENEENIDDDKNTLKYYTQIENETKILIDKAYENPNILERYNTVDLPSCVYTDVVFPKDDITLFVSENNDNHLQFDSKTLRLGCEFGGRQLVIPIKNDIQRISPLFSLSIVLYEIRRQISEKYVIK